MTISSDLDKHTTLGEADGPPRFIPELGMEVPTFIDPREDLMNKGDTKFQRLDYHVPFKLRGPFFPHDWPIEFYNTVRGGLHVAMDGHVLCHGVNKSGIQCSSRAMNRSMFCRNHGGALAIPDRKISGSTIVPYMPQDRVENLDRVQKFMQGLIPTSDLDDDEIKGQFVRDSNGYPVKTVKLGAKFAAQLTKELHKRLNEYLVSEAPDMLKIMTEIARNDLYEAQDRLRAAQWVTERVMGKTPDVLLTSSQTSAAYVGILDSLEGGSREDYREKVASSRVEVGAPYEAIDAELVNEDGTALHEEAEVLDRVQTIADERRTRLDRAKQIKKAKQRRYAARAVGAASLSDMPWLAEFVPKRDGGFKLKLIPPDKQTPAVIDRIRG